MAYGAVSFKKLLNKRWIPLTQNQWCGTFMFSLLVLVFVRLLSGVPDLWDRNKILRGGDLSHLHVPDCIWVFFYFVWFVFIHHSFQFYFELCTYCNILDIYLL